MIDEMNKMTERQAHARACRKYTFKRVSGTILLCLDVGKFVRPTLIICKRFDVYDDAQRSMSYTLIKLMYT